MRFASIKDGNKEVAAVLSSKGLIKVESINTKKSRSWSTNLFDIINRGELDEIRAWYLDGGKAELEGMADVTIAFDQVVYAPLYRTPTKIIGIGLNYAAEAGTIGEKAPTDLPGSFFKSSTSIIGTGDTIEIPYLPAEINGEPGYAKEVDAEGELAIIIGKEGKDIDIENWTDCVAGYTTAIECSVMDVFYRGLRQLSLCKSFDTLFTFGPIMVTPDEIDDILKLKVCTMYNGEIYAEDYVENMTFKPDYLISYFSKMLRWLPGDILSTGTPKGVIVEDGSMAGVEIDGFAPAKCPVKNKSR